MDGFLILTILEAIIARLVVILEQSPKKISEISFNLWFQMPVSQKLLPCVGALRGVEKKLLVFFGK